MALQIDLHPTSAIPLYVQLRSRLEYLIGTGALAPGTQLPSVRELSQQLEIAPSTVQQAYKELLQKGVIETQRGRGTFVPQIVTSRPPAVEQSAPLRRSIDNLIKAGQQQGFSLEQIRQLFEEQAALQERGLRVAFVGIREAMRKYATLVGESLADLRVTVTPLSLADLRQHPAPAELIEGYDVLVTLLFHYREIVELSSALSARVLPIISELSNQTLESIALLPAGARIGLVCHHASLSNYMATIQLYHQPAENILYSDPADEGALEQLLAQSSVILHTTVLTELVQARVRPGIPLIELKHVPNSSSLARVRAQIAELLGQ